MPFPLAIAAAVAALGGLGLLATKKPAAPKVPIAQVAAQAKAQLKGNDLKVYQTALEPFETVA